MLNSLAQTVLKIASPGVPDFYQGTEVWDFSLVDPDNRRPVDFDARQRLLTANAEKEREYGPDHAGYIEELLRSWEDGRLKLHVTSRGLACRKAHQALFMTAAYLPLAGAGARRNNLCAFARQGDSASIVVITPRLIAGLMQSTPEAPLGSKVWQDTCVLLPDQIAASIFTNVLTGERVEAVSDAGRRALPLAEVLRCLPVAMLAAPSG